MLSATHICRCGHYRATHEGSQRAEDEGGHCKECDCEAFTRAIFEALDDSERSRVMGAEAVAEVGEHVRPLINKTVAVMRRSAPARDAPEKPHDHAPSAAPFRVLVRRMRRAQKRYDQTHGSAEQGAARALEAQVDLMLAHDPEPPAEPDYQLEFPKLSEFLRRNPCERRKAGDKVAKVEAARSVKLGYDPQEARRRGERARSLFLAQR